MIPLTNHDFRVRSNSEVVIIMTFKYSSSIRAGFTDSGRHPVTGWCQFWLHTDRSISLFNDDGTKCRKRSEHRKFIYTAWWLTYPSEKYEWVTVGMMTFQLFPIYGYIWKNQAMFQTTNQIQPVQLCLPCLSPEVTTATPPRPVPETGSVASRVTLLPRLDRKLPIYSMIMGH